MKSTTNNIGQTDTILWLPKLTIQSIGCSPEQAVIRQQRVLLCKIGGTIRHIRDAPQRRFDTSTLKALIGQFGAINEQSDPPGTYCSGIAYLPNQWHDYLLKQVVETSPDPVEFAYTFYAEPLRRDPSRWGYEGQALQIKSGE
jgi:hypothetical protein